MKFVKNKVVIKQGEHGNVLYLVATSHSAYLIMETISIYTFSEIRLKPLINSRN
ncbi:hypothetical protein [Leptospira ellinghausenii]|uniref:hypothetical protein n=1 Tax=Leptospira ellinghausenii TaxID=1917822 RepID=UPI00142DD051|nr:hypothetical protein [Leptospira ellinghausenii]